MFQAEELETLGKRVDAIAGDMTNFGKTTNDNLAAINDRLTSHDQAIASIHDHDIATLTHRTDALENDLALVKVEVTGNTANITTNTNNITNITTNITTNTTNISSMNESITNIFQTLNKMNTKTAEQFDKIEDSLQQHRDSIHVTIKEMTEDNAKIRGIESQVAGLTDGHNGMRNDISKIEADLLNLNAVTQQCNTKVEEVTVLATNIDVHVKAQEKMIQQQADGDLKDIKAKIAELQELGTNYLSFRSEYVEPMHGQLSVIQQKLVQNADDAENTKTSYKTLIAGLQADIEGQIKLIKDEQIEHKEELHNAAEEFERLSQEIDSLKGNINNVSTTINEQLNIKFVSNRDELLNKIGEVEGKINNNHTAIANNAETFNDNMNKLKESLDKVSLNLNEQIVFNIESSNQGFESKIGDIYAKIQKNEEDIVNNNTSLNKEINILKESIENMSTNFGEQIEANITSHKESYNSMFGEIEDKLKKLHEEQLNCKDELSNAAEEFESINKELESLRENLQITTTSFTEKLNVNITSNNEAIDVRFGDLDEKINKASICINNVSETSKQDIIKLREDLDSITANAREQLEITINSNRESVSGEIENMNGRITNNETDISNLKDGAAEQSKKIQEALDNMSVSVDEKIEVNKNAINVTIKEIAEDNDKIRSIENELSGMAENLNNANASILKLKTDISNLDAVTQQFETKVEEVTVLATNIDVHVKAQEQMIQQQTEGDMNKINERITILEQKLNQNADEVDNSRNTYKILIEEMQAEIDGQIKLIKDEQVNHKEELHNAAEEFERLAKELEDIKANLTNVSASFNEQLEVNIVSNKENLDQTLGDINSRIKKNTDEIENISNKMKENIMEDVEVKVNQVRENIQINIESSNEKVLQHLSEEVDALKALVADLRVKEQDNLSEAIKMLEQQLETLKQNIEISVNVAQKDSQENLKSKLDEMDEKLQDVLNKNQENINLVVNMKEENNILMKSNSDDLKNEINDKLTDLTIMIENLKTLEKEDNEMVIKLVDDRNSKINTDLEKMMVDLHNKLDEQKDNFNVSIELSQQNMQGSLLTIIDQIKYDLDSLKQKEQEGKDLIIIDLQNKFDKFKDEINLVIDDSKQFSEGTNRDIAALQILIDDLKQKQKEDYDVILQISNDQDAKNRNDTNKLIENLVTKINSLKDNMDSSVADQMEEMKLTINDLRSQTTNDIKIFLDKNEEKAAENLTELKKLVSELEKEVEDLKKKMKEDMDVVFQLNQESEKKNNDAGEKLLIELENKIASLKDSIDININMSKDDTAEKIKAIQRSLDDLKKKEDEQIEVVVNDIDKKLDAIKQEININIDNSKSSDESFTKKINELTLQIQGLVEKDHSNETLIVNLEKDTSDKLKGLSNLLEEVRKQGADDIQVIIAANAEKNEDALSNLKFLQEKIDEIAKDLDDLKNKEKQDYDVVIQLNNDKFNQLKENENNLKKDIDSKIASIQENINVTIIKSENKIEEEMKENLEKIKNDLEELKKQEAKNINESIANMDEKIAKIQENVEVTINVSQKAAEQNLSAKIEEIEKELRSMKENEQETLEGVITDLENKMKALKENIEVNINMTQNNYEEEIKNKLNHISIDLQDLKNKEVENENELKRATDEVKGNVDKEIKEINNKLEISINDLRNKTKAENEELDKSTKEDIERIDALCITLRALFDELKEKKKEDLELLLKINHDNAEEAKNTADNMMKEVESRILMMKDNIEININNTQKNIEDGLSKKVDDLSIVVEDLKKKEHEDMTIIINNIDEKMKHQQENNDENLLEKLEELRKQFEQKDKDNMDIVIQMDQANKDNTMQALEDKVNEIKKEIQLNINILNEKYDKNFNDSGIEVSMLADKLSDLEKSGDLLNSSLANISLEIEDKFKGDYAALRLRIEDLEKVKDQISELDDSITLLQPDVAGNKESIASLRLFESKQIKDFDELKKHSQEMLIVHRSEVDAKLKELFGLRDTQDQHGKEYKAFVESIMVQLEGLVIENTTQNDKMGKLDDFTKNMDEKFKELEQADSFLQETHMDLTKRTQFVETEIKRVEAASLALIKDQRTDAEELKVELKKVDSKTNPFFDRFEELQNQITLNKGGIVENSEKISYNTNGIQDITEILNNLKQKVEINIEDISLNKQHIQKNVGDFNVRLDDIHGDINSNFDEKLEKLNVLFNETMDAHAKGEDAKHQKISNTCTMLEMDLNSTNEKLSKLDGLHQQLKDQLAGQNSQYSEAMQQFRGQLDGLNVQHTETIQQMKEVTVLATNIDVHVKEQQAQQAIDTTNYDEKINEVKGFADDLSRDFIALSERLKTFDELSKNQGERILLIERLGDQLEQLSEETREDKQSIKSLWDEFHNQRERSNYFDGLMNKYDSERQQSEAKTKEEINITVQSNNKVIFLLCFFSLSLAILIINMCAIKLIIPNIYFFI